MITLWQWFNGKKMIIGGLVFLAADAMAKIFGFWNYNPEWMTPTIDTMKYIGDVLVGVGAVHKLSKQ